MRIFPVPAHAAGELPLQHFPGVAQLAFCAENGRGLKSNVHHAIRAARVISWAVLLPRSLLDQFPVRAVVIVRDQIAGPFPSARIEGWCTPSGAVELPLAAQEIEINRGH